MICAEIAAAESENLIRITPAEETRPNTPLVCLHFECIDLYLPVIFICSSST